MTNTIHLDVQAPSALLANFADSTGAAEILGRSRATVCDLAEKGVITRYRVGTAVLYYRPELLRIGAALRVLRVRGLNARMGS